MSDTESGILHDILACPGCGSDALRAFAGGAHCESCGERYPRLPTGALDLRPRSPVTRVQRIEVGLDPVGIDSLDTRTLAPPARPEVDFSEIRPPAHLSRELLGHFPAALHPGAPMLDIGCGDAAHRGVCEHAGFRYLGLDRDSTAADILADAHLLPFRDNAFRFVLSVAVLQYLRFPVLAMREVHRVLAPGGIFIGTVAFLEPFHDTYYHHTHLGTFHSLREGGFEVQRLAPTRDWDVLIAQARMGLFPRMPALLSRAIVLPVQLLHRLWWGLGGLLSQGASEPIRQRNTAGSFAFVARKPGPDEGPDSA